MPHVLISPNLYPDETLRGYLRRWGWTCEAWDCGSPLGPGNTLRDPDALLASAREAEDAGLVRSGKDAAVADGPEGQATAPLLVVGGPDPVAAGGIWLQDYGHEGSRLRGALQACLAFAGPAGRRAAEGSLGTDLLDLLGHELRTPLTAIKTALEILAVDLAADRRDDGADRAEGDSRVKMVEVALRNVERLDRTVDWGQTLLGTAPGTPGDGLQLALSAPVPVIS